jgi:hypothetical protein
MKALLKNSFLTFVWISLVGVACNLASTSEAPPTLAPYITSVAVATLGYQTPVPGAGVTPTSSVPPTPIPTTLYTMLNQVDETRMMLHIRQLQDFGTRHVNSVGKTDGTGISAAYDYLNGEFNKIQQQSNGRFTNYSPHPFTMTTGDGVVSDQRNVFGVINGTEPGAGVIVVGAHYDSRTNDPYDATSSAPGADDNGSGVAAILDLARIMSQYPSRASVIFVLFSGEEDGRWGSVAFVRDYIQGKGIPVTVMINLDTIGNYHDVNGNVNDREIRLFADPRHEPSVVMAQMIDFIADQTYTDLTVMLQNTIDREGRFGDHQSFSEKGYAAVRIIEAVEESGKREALDFIEYIEPVYLVKATRTIMSILVALANGPRPPDGRNVVIRDDGGGTRRLVWEPVPGAIGYVVALRLPDSRTFDQVFSAPGTGTAYECDCFVSSRYQSLAIAAVSADGIMGPLSIEYRVP